jgi:hypothetical protein
LVHFELAFVSQFSGTWPVLSSACIIPVVGTADRLEGTLVSVLEHRPDNCEVIVVLNTSYDDPFELRGEIQFIEAPPATGLVGCINLGIAAATAPIVHVLASGFEASNGWLEKATQHFSDPRVAAVTPIVYDAAERDRLIAAGVGWARGGSRTIGQVVPKENCESSRESIGPLSVAGSYRKAALIPFGGGLPVEVGDHLADLDLALSLTLAGWTIPLDSTCQVFGVPNEEPRGGGFTSGLWSERLFWRHARRLGLMRELLSHAKMVVAKSLQAPAQVFGRLAAICQLGHYAAYRLMFEAAKRQLEVTQAGPPNLNATEKAAIESPSAPRRRVDAPHRKSQRAENSSARAARTDVRRRTAS